MSCQGLWGERWGDRKVSSEESLLPFTPGDGFLGISHVRLVEDNFLCHFHPRFYISARSRRRGEAGHHCCAQTCLGLFSDLSQALGSPGCPVPLSPTPSKPCKPQRGTFRTFASERAPTAPTSFSYCAERIWLCQKCRFSILEKPRNISNPWLHMKCVFLIPRIIHLFSFFSFR